LNLVKSGDEHVPETSQPGIVGEPNAQVPLLLLQQCLDTLDHVHQDLSPTKFQFVIFVNSFGLDAVK
jgi:hypothetical protein